MSQPIPPVPDPDIADARAAAALVGLIALLHTDPLARPLLGSVVYSPRFTLAGGELSLRLSDLDAGAEQLAAAKALFGGTVAEETSYQTAAVAWCLTTTWQGVPFEVHVSVAREDEMAALRKQVADLQRERDAARPLPGQLDEQRHQVHDAPAPHPSAYLAPELVVAGGAS